MEASCANRVPLASDRRSARAAQAVDLLSAAPSIIARVYTRKPTRRQRTGTLHAIGSGPVTPGDARGESRLTVSPQGEPTPVTLDRSAKNSRFRGELIVQLTGTLWYPSSNRSPVIR